MTMTTFRRPMMQSNIISIYARANRRHIHHSLTIPKFTEVHACKEQDLQHSTNLNAIVPGLQDLDFGAFLPYGFGDSWAL